jgi:D-alanyl-lipoteichoic acid acyltransferase DltB (MBOAT superfamily)
VAFFPQLVAGPIVRARELLPQLSRPPRLTTRGAGEGLFLILLGMTKKVAVADFLAARLNDRVWDDPQAFSSTEVLIAVYAYSFQLYADFSGYTDIARGSARLFGLELPENFDRPYTATGPIEFWKRWHITLSRWVQDYLYVPLGGSRRGEPRTYLNLFVTFFLIGIWHGAGWTFVLFGLWHATAVTLNRLYRRLRGDPPPAVGAERWAFTALHLGALVLHWPIFRSPGLDSMLAMYRQLFAFEWAPFRVEPAVLLVIAVATAAHFSPKRWAEAAREAVVRLPAPAQAGLAAAVGAFLLVLSGEQAAPFIYFQF